MLLLAPVPLSPAGLDLYVHVYGCKAEILAQNLATPFSKIAKEAQVDFLDLAKVIPYADAEDGMHLTAFAHHAIAKALEEPLKKWFNL